MERIYLGIVRKCPDVNKIGKFAYHLVHVDKSGNIDKERQTDSDLCYWVSDENDLKRRLTSILSEYENVEIVNGIPDVIWDGWAIDYRFDLLHEEQFRRISGKS